MRQRILIQLQKLFATFHISSGRDGDNVCWIGLNDASSENSFVFEDGTSLGAYSNWDGGSASNAGMIYLVDLAQHLNFYPSRGA